MAKEKITITRATTKTVSLKKVFDRLLQTNTRATKDLRDILQKSAINFLQLDREQKLQFNIVTADIRKKIEELEMLENQIKANILVVPPSEVAKLENEINSLIQDKFITNRIPRGKALLIGQGRSKDLELTAEEKEALKFQKIKLDARAIERRTPAIQISNTKLEYIKKLFRVADGLDAANWDELADIRDIIGLDPIKWERGHTSSSIASFNLEVLLQDTQLLPEQRRGLQKLLLISRLIDKADKNTFKTIESTLGKKIKNITYDTAYELIGELLNSSGIDLSANIEVYKEIKFSSEQDATVAIYVDFEASEINQLKGKLSQVVASAATSILLGQEPGSKAKLDFGRLFGGLENVTRIEGSPPLISIVETVINSTILGKKVRDIIKHKKSFKGKATKLRIPRQKKTKLNTLPSASTIRNRFKKLINVREATEVEQQGINTFSLKNLINGMMAEQVEKQMAASSSNDGRLRYQTGRFAESANLLTLTRTQAGILYGTYTYQRDPYDVFLPGHKMGTPKRDPRIYIEGAAREAAMLILKDKFPGIQLELK